MALGQAYSTWTDNTGNYKTEAKFLTFKHNHVYLEKQDGTIVKVHPSRMSIEDMERIREELKAEAMERRAENALQLRQYRDAAKARYPNRRRDVFIANRSGAIHGWRIMRTPYGPRWYYGTSTYVMPSYQYYSWW